MKLCLSILALTLASHAIGATQPTPKKAQVIEIHRATIIAFEPPPKPGELENGEGDAEAYNDFAYYMDQAEIPLRKSGIEFRSVLAREFVVRDGKRIRTFKTGKIEIGYYLIAPGNGPRIDYGVMTDQDLFDEVLNYFRIAIQQKK
jgi:hypothetical protein